MSKARSAAQGDGEDHSADRVASAFNQPTPSFIKNTREESSELFLAAGIKPSRIRRKKPGHTPWHSSLVMLLISLVALTAALPRPLRKFSIAAFVATLLYHRGPLFWFRWHIWAKCKVIDARKPRKIILIRHGESLGNVDKNIYCRVPDNRVPLSEKGKREAEEAGKQLRNLIGDDTARFFVSPYLRSQQTFEHILKGGLFPDERFTVREDARLREQDFGNLQVPQDMEKALAERKVFGTFYYRFPNGESGADVYDRVTSFWASLMREFKYQHCLEHFVIISHGITCRMLLMRYFKWTVAEFEQLWNFENCEMAVLELQPSGRYELVTPLRRTKRRPLAPPASPLTQTQTPPPQAPAPATP